MKKALEFQKYYLAIAKMWDFLDAEQKDAVRLILESFNLPYVPEFHTFEDSIPNRRAIVFAFDAFWTGCAKLSKPVRDAADCLHMANANFAAPLPDNPYTRLGSRGGRIKNELAQSPEAIHYLTGHTPNREVRGLL